MMLTALYLATPAFVANMLPVVAARFGLINALAQPVHVKLFGTHKTWRGFVVGIFGAVLITALQWWFGAPHLTSATVAVLFGFLAGVGALGGDILKSYFKRLVGISSGAPFIPFDYIDYMLGFLLFTYPLYQWSAFEALFLLVVALVGNPLINGLGYFTGIKSTYW